MSRLYPSEMEKILLHIRQVNEIESGDAPAGATVYLNSIPVFIEAGEIFGFRFATPAENNWWKTRPAS